ncbi:hypothetical protein T01_2862 [Trichinella spiralis]|uniref:Uncharacterized protein n=1 Tax=Trichinella spiralis TaxID=6334 RepID=A0A0V1AV70_TRISP|nr:hypothetical protein T01_2862 [Trichinella spiralis]
MAYLNSVDLCVGVVNSVLDIRSRQLLSNKHPPVTSQDIYEQPEWFVGHLVIEPEEIKIFFINLKTLSPVIDMCEKRDKFLLFSHLTLIKGQRKHSMHNVRSSPSRSAPLQL